MYVFGMFLLSAMAFVGPLQMEHPDGARPFGVFCEVCNMHNLLVWRCYNCGGQYCGRCIFRHRIVTGVTVAEMDADRVSANEVGEGMHILYFRFFQRLRSEMACDPAEANELFSRAYVCN